jgi:PHD/YefM family antitoxin component YafN of YafNO toxin-antitoxin module
MAETERVVTSVGELVRDFSYYSDVALAKPVMVTKNDRPRVVLTSVEEYERLKRRDRQAFRAADTPEQFLADIEAVVSGTR